MERAVLDITTIDIKAGGYLFRTTGSILRFPGFRAVYLESEENAQNGDRQPLPDVKKDERLNLEKIDPEQSFTKPPPRYSEATLVKELEERGIGRPSTYAQIISTILSRSRNYVIKENGRFKPTDVGELVTRMLMSSFPNILDPEFTAKMENELDEVEDGKRNWVAMMRDFYDPFTEALEDAADKMYDERKRLEEVTENECAECSKPLIIKWGKYGKFMGCSGYPDCTYTEPLNGKGTGPGASRPVSEVREKSDCTAAQPARAHVLRLRGVPGVRLCRLGPARSGEAMPRMRRAVLNAPQDENAPVLSVL